MNTAAPGKVETKLEESDSEDYDELESKTDLECATLRKGSIVKTATIKKEYSRSYLSRITCTSVEIHQACTLLVLGLVLWGLAYTVSGARWDVGGDLFRLAALATLGHAAGRLLRRLTTLPPLLGALLTGVLLRNVGFIDIRDYAAIDSFLRKVYPVVILGKSALALDWRYLSNRARRGRVLALGALPWATEVLALAICLRYLLDYTWQWGFLAGTVLSSLTPAVLAPTLREIRARGLGRSALDAPRLVPGAGCVDTTLSVGCYGLLLSAMFSRDDQLYTVLRACATMFAGVALGVCWGLVSGAVPGKRDPFVAESRLLMVLGGGLFANFGTLAIGWGGTGGVAVLLCNLTAANCWRRTSGWEINGNPVASAYRVMWTVLEPVLFTCTGAHVLGRFVCNNHEIPLGLQVFGGGQLSEVSARTALLAAGALAAALVARLAAVFLLGCAWRRDLALRERLFLCLAWMPKAIVEAVLAPTALEAVGPRGADEERRLARTNIHLVVLAVLLTTPLAALLAGRLGPVLLTPTQPVDAEQTSEDTEPPGGAGVWRTRLGDLGDKPPAPAHDT